MNNTLLVNLQFGLWILFTLTILAISIVNLVDKQMGDKTKEKLYIVNVILSILSIIIPMSIIIGFGNLFNGRLLLGLLLLSYFVIEIISTLLASDYIDDKIGNIVVTTLSIITLFVCIGLIYSYNTTSSPPVVLGFGKRRR